MQVWRPTPMLIFFGALALLVVLSDGPAKGTAHLTAPGRVVAARGLAAVPRALRTPRIPGATATPQELVAKSSSTTDQGSEGQPTTPPSRGAWIACAVTATAAALYGAVWRRAPKQRIDEADPASFSVHAQPFAAAALALGTALSPVALDLALPPHPAQAAELKRSLAEIAGSGLIFKDKLLIDAFADPRFPGVTVYISDFDRPLTEKLQKDFFSDPTQAGLACVSQGAVVPSGPVPPVEEVFKEAKSLFAKSLRVDRVYDKEAQAVVYVAYNTRLDKNADSNKSRFKSALCAVPLQPAPLPPTPVEQPLAPIAPAPAPVDGE